jgi:transposase-like protein
VADVSKRFGPTDPANEAAVQAAVISRPKQALTRVTMERDILKTATKYVAKDAK